MRVEELSCGRLILCGGEGWERRGWEREGEDGRGGAATEEAKSRTGGGGSGSFCFFQVGSAAVWLEVGLGLGFFYGFPLLCKIALPFSCVCWRPVFIGKNVARFPTWSLNFFFFFVNLIFLNFFVFFFKTSNINIDSMRKINNFKNDAWKVERVRKTFENLNSF